MNPVQKKSFWALMVTQFCGAFNDNVFKTLVTLLILRWVTHVDQQEQMVALTGAVFVAPFLLFSMIAGRVAGKINKPRVIIATTWWEVSVIFLMVFSFWMKSIPWMLAALFVQAAQSAFFSPAKYGVLPEIMGEDEISKANGWINIGTFAAILIGTVIATWTAFNLVLSCVIMTIASLTGLWASMQISLLPAAKPLETLAWNPFTDLWANWKLISQDRALKSSCISVNAFWFFGAIFQLNIFLYAHQMIQASEATTGLLLVPVIVGIGLGSFLAGLISGKHIELGWVTVGAAGVGLFCIDLFWAYHWMPRLVFDLFFLGFSSGFFEIPLLSLIQWRSPKEDRGRVLATVNFLSFLAILSASGFLWLLNTFFQFDPAAVFLSLGILAVIGMIFMNAVFPEVRERFIALLRRGFARQPAPL